MKLTEEERQLLRSHRSKRKEEEIRKRQAEEAWAAEQARLDRPGWCAGCGKSERQVAQERKWVGNKVVNGRGVVRFLQLVGGGAMSTEDFEERKTMNYCSRCFARVIASLPTEET